MKGYRPYLPLSTTIQLFYTVAQQRKLHKQFAHPSETKLYNHLKTAGTKDVAPKTLEKLEYLVSTCDSCQRIRAVLKRYHVTVGAENTQFNAKVYIDFMYIEGAPVLHMVYDAIHFAADQFVEPLTTDSVWESILTLWATIYTGWPNILVFDDSSQFRDTIVGFCEIHTVEWQKSRTQHHSTLGIGERCHEPIRWTFRKLRIDHSRLKK